VAGAAGGYIGRHADEIAEGSIGRKIDRQEWPVMQMNGLKDMRSIMMEAISLMSCQQIE
jgi:hypothetical protein